MLEFFLAVINRKLRPRLEDRILAKITDTGENIAARQNAWKLGEHKLRASLAFAEDHSDRPGCVAWVII